MTSCFPGPTCPATWPFPRPARIWPRTIPSPPPCLFPCSRTAAPTTRTSCLRAKPRAGAAPRCPILHSRKRQKGLTAVAANPFHGKLVPPARLEHAAYCLGGSRSIHLSYGGDSALLRGRSTVLDSLFGFKGKVAGSTPCLERSSCDENFILNAPRLFTSAQKVLYSTTYPPRFQLSRKRKRRIPHGIS